VNYHRDIADMYSSIGTNYYKEEQLIRALEYFEKASILYERFSNNNSPLAGIVLTNIGFTLLRLGRASEAKIQFKKAESVLMNYYPKDNKTLGEIRKTLLNLK
jgi:tetratricopeptide (TPR) repeat protein